MFDDPATPVPTELRTEQFTLRPITAADADRDFAAVMDTREELRSWEQTGWPADDFTVEANREDLVDLERRHAEHRAYTYTVSDLSDDVCLGCVYIFPTTATFLSRSTVRPVSDQRWSDTDAVVYFWVRSSSDTAGLDDTLLAYLRRWMAEDWGCERNVFVTGERYERQRRLLESTDLRVRFEITEPGKPGRYLAFG